MAIPILLCGNNEAAAKAIKETLEPEFEAIYYVASPEAGVTEVPQIFKGETPTDPASNLGTGNFTSVPKAILVSSDYDNEWVKGISSMICVPIVKPAPGGTPTPSGQPDPAVVTKVAESAKSVLQKLVDEGKLGSGDSGIYEF